MARALADHIPLDHRRACDLMTHPVITANETATPAEIADLLLRHRIKRVPIVREGHLVGIFSRADLIRDLALRRDQFDGLEWQPSRLRGDNPAIVLPANIPPAAQSSPISRY